ncbi:MAG TPA: VOC family protein [Gemmatimonadales bacterium]|nr:VOC family protein [Gemmatimonadales bacterium]
MDSPIANPRSGGRAQLPSDTHIGRVRLRVGDLERSLRFYRDVLGLGIAREEGSKVALAPRSSPRELILLEERPGIRRRPSRPVMTGLYHVALLVPSRAELGRALLGLNQAQYPLRGMSDHAVSESLYLDDPDGNGLEIYADRPRAQWPIRDGVVQMTVDPMDVEGVISAAQPVSLPWRGLPAGTVVGHVHFTVSDLERAVRFYRNVIGFDMMMRVPSLAAVSAGGYHHHLNLNTWAGEGAPPDSDQVAGLAGWELRVPDARARRDLIDRLAGAGALTGSPSGAAARDPDAIPIDIEEAP